VTATGKSQIKIPVPI